MDILSDAFHAATHSLHQQVYKRRTCQHRPSQFLEFLCVPMATRFAGLDFPIAQSTLLPQTQTLHGVAERAQETCCSLRCHHVRNARTSCTLPTLVAPQMTKHAAAIARTHQCLIFTKHRYVSIMATAPEREGEGHCSALMRAMCRAADADGLPTYLEAGSDRNVAVYRCTLTRRPHAQAVHKSCRGDDTPRGSRAGGSTSRWWGNTRSVSRETSPATHP